MPARCLNKALLIGNLTRDPELRYTPSGSAVCSFGLATNRYWTTDTGERKEDTQFHRIVSWNKLAEICSQLLRKGDKVYLEGRIQTREWTGSDGVARKTTEVVISDMILLRSQRGREGEEVTEVEGPEEEGRASTEGALEVQAPAEEGEEGKEKADQGGKAAVAVAADDVSAQADVDQTQDEKKEKRGRKKKDKDGGKKSGKKGEEVEEDVEIPEDKTPF